MYPSGTNYLGALCNLVPPDSQASWCHRVARLGQDAKFGQIGHLEWPTSVDFRGDLVKPRLDSRDLISPLAPCIGVWRACYVGCLLFPEGMVKRSGRKQQETQNLATCHAL